MKRFLLLISLLFAPAPVHAQGFAMLQANSVATVCDFRTGIAYGVGASTCVSPLPTCDGVTEDTPSFDAFNAWGTTFAAAHAVRLELFLPPNSTCTLNSFGADFANLNNFVLKGYGSGLFASEYSGYHMANTGMFQNTSHSVRLLSANVGDTSITMFPSSPSQPSMGGACTSFSTCGALFTVGKGALITGMDMQTGTGFPPNHGVFEYIFPKSINTTTGVITLASPLQHQYLSTWPSFNPNGAPNLQGPDFGGPATLYALAPGWTSSYEFQGLRFTVTAGFNTFTGNASGTTLTVSSFATDPLNAYPLSCNGVFGSIIVGPGVPANTQITACGTGSGGNGTYTTNNSITASGVAMKGCCAETEWDTDNYITVFRDTSMTISAVDGNPNNNCWFPSISHEITIFNNNAANCTSEVDKDVDTVTVINSKWNVWFFQSLTPYNFTMDNSTAFDVTGSPRNITIKNGSIVSDSFLPGVSKYGQTRTINVNNSIINSIANQGVSDPGGMIFEGDTAQGINNIAGWSISGGVITIPNTYFFDPTVNPQCLYGCPTVAAFGNPMGWATIGQWNCFGDTFVAQCATMFQVTAVSQDATNVYVTISPALNAWPTWSGIGTLYIRGHPGLSTTFTTSSGTTGEAAMLSDAAAAGLPMYSYYHRSWNNASTGGSGTRYWTMFGALTSQELNVNPFYGGGTAFDTTGPSIFSNGFNTSLSLVNYAPTVSLNTPAADRTLAVSGFPSAWANAQTNDTLPNLTQSLWAYTVMRDSLPDLSGDHVNNFTINSKMIVNPGVTVPPY